MKQYFFIPLAACVLMDAAETKAMPIATVSAPTLSIPVASGCGLGVHRGPFDGCETIYDGNFAGSGRNPYNHYYVGFGRGGFCGGRGTHLACNSVGLCRVVCN
jgi:hypothetical protein